MVRKQHGSSEDGGQYVTQDQLKRLEEIVKRLQGIRAVNAAQGPQFLGKTALAILKYIKDNQDKYKDLDEGITKQHVAKYLDNASISSRPTTLRIIDGLLEQKIILDDKKKENARSRLILGSSLDFAVVFADLLTNVINATWKEFADFIEDDGRTQRLIDELLIIVSGYKSEIAP